MSQSDLARLSGLSRPYVSRIENGTRNPSEAALLAIAKALRMRASDLNYSVVPHKKPKRDGKTDAGQVH